MRAFLLLVVASFLTAGCVGPADAPERGAPSNGEAAENAAADASPPGADAAAPRDPWRGKDTQTLVHVETTAVGADALCAGGGGYLLERSAGRVSPGAARVVVDIQATGYQGIQIGYVLDVDPGMGESDQTGITWLPVFTGTEARHEVPVAEDALEHEGMPKLWAFYLRVNPANEDNLCYTGAELGQIALDISAQRG